MGKTLKKVLNVISTILVAIVVVLALLLVGARFIGLNVYTVLSGSMEPTYHVGSLIYVKDVDTDELKAGDVITYMLDEDTIVTHRIVDVIPDETDPSIIRFQSLALLKISCALQETIRAILVLKLKFLTLRLFFMPSTVVETTLLLQST